jgi:hypothetical protein
MGKVFSVGNRTFSSFEGRVFPGTDEDKVRR